jgi:GcrA cell cycle regulator
MKPGSPWTQDRVAELRRLAADGLSSTEIGTQFGVSRNAVISACRRYGASLKVTNSSRARQARPVPAMAINQRPRANNRVKNSPRFGRAALLPAMAKPAKKFVPRLGKAADSPCSLLELRWNTCRWPYGDPGHVDFHFCGGDAVDGKPYCRDHLIVARG